jgi:hypothetical protein
MAETTVPSTTNTSIGYKKIIAIVIVCLLWTGGIGIGCYIWGWKSHSPSSSSPSIDPIPPAPVTTINKPYDKNSVCGKEIKVKPSIDKNYKVRLEMYDNCKNTIAWYQVNVSCPEFKHQLGLGPGVLFYYSNELKKFSLMVGGKAQYLHYWGHFGLGPDVGYYQSLDKNMYAAQVDILFNYRW